MRITEHGKTVKIMFRAVVYKQQDTECNIREGNKKTRQCIPLLTGSFTPEIILWGPFLPSIGLGLLLIVMNCDTGRHYKAQWTVIILGDTGQL